jgi:thiamine pyrophosphate-dependent acetolactate synthase large subunit-like protein
LGWYGGLRNNGALGFVKVEMKSSGYVTFSIDLKNPSFAKVAESIGIFGVRVERTLKATSSSLAVAVCAQRRRANRSLDVMRHIFDQLVNPGLSWLWN